MASEIEAVAGRASGGPVAAGLVCLGTIAGAHGLRGLVKVKSFTEDPEAIAAYGPLTDAAGTRRFDISIVGQHKDTLLAAVVGVVGRDRAETLRGTRLYVPRDRLPPPEEDEFYHADLIGLSAETADGPVGTVRAVHDFGAGPMLEIALASGAAPLVPFTRDAVPEVDVAGGRVIIDSTMLEIVDATTLEPPAPDEAEPEERP